MPKFLIVLSILFALVMVVVWLRRRVRKLGFLPLLLILALTAPALMAFAPMGPTFHKVSTALLGLDGLQLELELDPILLAVLQQFLTMGGFAALIAIVINVLKTVGVVKDGTSGTWSAIANLIGLIGVFVVQNYVPSVNITAIDEHLGIIAQIGTSIFNYIFDYWISAKTHEVLANGEVPVIGTSHSRKLLPLPAVYEAQVGETK